MNICKLNQLANEIRNNCLTFFTDEELRGYEGGHRIMEWFLLNTIHPHPLHSFEVEAMNRNEKLEHTTRFAHDLVIKMAYLVAENELI